MISSGKKLELTAINDISETRKDRSGKCAWTATGNDPYFHLSRRDARPLSLDGGWYLLCVEASETSGHFQAPRLYVDYGYGFSEASAFALDTMRSEEGFRGLLRFDQKVIALRLDPSVAPCEFHMGACRVKRLSRLGAAWFMYRELVKREKAPLALFRRALGEYRARGAKMLGDWLYARYTPSSSIGALDYRSWVSRHDIVSKNDFRTMRQQSVTDSVQPTISVIMPVYNTAEEWLRRCIESVLNQAYPHWELCIADDASTEPHVKQLLTLYASKDSRIKVVYRERNGHISEASNSALALASGRWIALLDHDDELPPHALYLVSKAIIQHPDARVIYSDEDKIDEVGQRFDPYLKPDWNPDLFLSQNMISHLGVYSTDLVRAVGGFRKGYEGSQDYDLALRCIETLGPHQILHIPHVLYHWRAIEGSTARAKGEKSYASIAGGRALEDHLMRTGVRNAVVHAADHGYRVQRMVNATSEPKVSLVIPTRDRVDLLKMCVQSILEKTDYDNYEIIVVDNQSVDPATHDYFDEIRRNPKVRIIEYDEPFNYSLMNNVAVASTNGEIVGLINNDIEVIEGCWLREMVSQAMRPEIGAVGAMLYYPNDTIQHAGVVLGIGGVANHAYVGKPRGYSGQMSRALLIQNLSAVTAACLLIRRETFDLVGGLDARLQVAFNDVDFCLRVREQGYRNLWTPYAALYHHESASRGYEDTPAKHDRFMREVMFVNSRWGDQLKVDPAYNPNLTLGETDFSLAVEPRGPRLASIVSANASVLSR